TKSRLQHIHHVSPLFNSPPRRTARPVAWAGVRVGRKPDARDHTTIETAVEGLVPRVVSGGPSDDPSRSRRPRTPGYPAAPHHLAAVDPPYSRARTPAQATRSVAAVNARAGSPMAERGSAMSRR